MAQPHVMADFMGGGLRDVGFVVREVVEVNPGRPISGVRGTSENIHISDSARRGGRVGGAIRVCIPGDQCQCGPRGKRGRPLGGDIDVERGVILRHPFPDSLDRHLFRVAIRCVIRVGAEGHRRDARPPQAAIPGRARNGFPIQIQVDDIGRAGSAVETQAGREGAHRHSRFGGYRWCRGRRSGGA